MKAESINIIWDYLNPARIFGPILEKELRVSSRRKRNYFLRSIYIVLLGIIILFMWFTAIAISNASSSIFQISRSAIIGKNVTIAIIWFQFIVSQLLAIIMLSSSISNEIRSGTLNVLMTTPVKSFQIVTGKLFSKLLQILIILSISLPLLSIIRVFGGTPWNYVVFSLCITLTSVIFAGSLSLFLSVFIRQAYRVIILEILGYILFYALFPFLFTITGILNSNMTQIILTLTNPFFALIAALEGMTPGLPTGYFLLIHCLIMLCISLLFLGISILKVRSVSIPNVSYRHKKNGFEKVIKDKNGTEIAHYSDFSGNIKRVGNNPIIWKENYGGFFGKGKVDKLVTILIYLLALFGIIFILFFGAIGSILVYIAMFGMYLILMLRLAISTAGSISSEKEARTLPVLLVTPLDDKDIIMGKVKAGIWRNISIIILYLLLQYSLLFSYRSRGIVFSQLIYQIPLSVIGIASSVLFIAGCGVYFGVRMKNSTSAIAATIGTFFVAYLLLRIFNPIQVMVLVGMTRHMTNIHLIQFISIVSSLVSTILLGGIGWFFLRISILKLRSSIF